MILASPARRFDWLAGTLAPPLENNGELLVHLHCGHAGEHTGNHEADNR